MELPEAVYRFMRESEMAWLKLVQQAQSGQAKWTDEQQKELALFAEVLSKDHNALKHLIDAIGD